MDMSGTPVPDEVERFKSGPVGVVFYRTTGADPTSPDAYIHGSIHFFVSALIVGTLLCLAGPGLCSFAARWAFVTLLDIFAAVSINLANPIWFHYPWEFSLKMSAYDASNWLLAGIVLAAIVRNKTVCCAPATPPVVELKK